MNLGMGTPAPPRWFPLRSRCVRCCKAIKEPICPCNFTWLLPLIWPFFPRSHTSCWRSLRNFTHAEKWLVPSQLSTTDTDTTLTTGSLQIPQLLLVILSNYYWSYWSYCQLSSSLAASNNADASASMGCRIRCIATWKKKSHYEYYVMEKWGWRFQFQFVSFDSTQTEASQKIFCAIRNLHVLVCRMHTLGPVIVGLYWKMESRATSFNLRWQIVSQFNGFCFIKHFHRRPILSFEPMIISRFPNTPHDWKFLVHRYLVWSLLQMHSPTWGRKGMSS